MINESLIGIGHSYHSRKVGGQNSFRYPGFYLLFSCEAEKSVQTVFRKNFLSLLSIRSKDYLAGRSGPLSENIKMFLKENCNGFEPQEVWLHTLPRMFWYAFNPVSFWFCRRDGKLEAALVEVNNTFGERHFYWINPDQGIEDSKWYQTEKHFHVSPFFPVDGHYLFRFQLNAHGGRVDINHHDSNGGLRLATWVEGIHSPLKDQSLISILFRFGWITPMVVIRIHWQAVRLFFKKNKFYSKPELPSKEVSL